MQCPALEVKAPTFMKICPSSVSMALGWQTTTAYRAQGYLKGNGRDMATFGCGGSEGGVRGGTRVCDGGTRARLYLVEARGA
jgi:hypothetical protein